MQWSSAETTMTQQNLVLHLRAYFVGNCVLQACFPV